jgi:hypothetical protein
VRAYRRFKWRPQKGRFLKYRVSGRTARELYLCRGSSIDSAPRCLRHAPTVSGPLSGNLEPLQILRITRWITGFFIGHNNTPPTESQSN